MRELGDRVGRGRRDQVHLRALHELQMARRFVIGRLLSGKGAARGVALELAHEHRRAAQRSEGSRTYEAPARRRLHHPHGMSGSGRQAHQLERLVCGDAATYAEQDSGHSLTFSPAPQLASAGPALARRG